MTVDSKIIRALLTLVRAGLWCRTPDDPEALSLSPEEWMEVLRLTGRHAVYGLVSEGVDLIGDDSLMPPAQVMKRLVLQSYKYEKQYSGMLGLTRSIFAEFEAKGLHPVLQKGAAVASLYERPELRPSGDIDIWFPPHEFGSAVPENAEHTSDGGVSYVRDGVDIEHHRYLVDVFAPSNRKFVSKLVEDEGFCVCGAGVRSTSPLVTLLVLDCHVLKHVFGWGIGLRQICDYAKARQLLNYDKSAFESAVRKMGLAKWTRILDSLCDSYILYQPSACPGSKVRKLFCKVIDAGNFSVDDRDGKSTLGAFVSSSVFSMGLCAREWFWMVVSFSAKHLGISP